MPTENYYLLFPNGELYHADHKYVKREMVNGKWRYWYELPKGDGSKATTPDSKNSSGGGKTLKDILSKVSGAVSSASKTVSSTSKTVAKQDAPAKPKNASKEYQHELEFNSKKNSYDIPGKSTTAIKGALSKASKSVESASAKVQTTAAGAKLKDKAAQPEGPSLELKKDLYDMDSRKSIDKLVSVALYKAEQAIEKTLNSNNLKIGIEVAKRKIGLTPTTETFGKSEVKYDAKTGKYTNRWNNEFSTADEAFADEKRRDIVWEQVEKGATKTYGKSGVHYDQKNRVYVDRWGYTYTDQFDAYVGEWREDRLREQEVHGSSSYGKSEVKPHSEGNGYYTTRWGGKFRSRNDALEYEREMDALKAMYGDNFNP